MGLVLLMCLYMNTEVTCGKCNLKDGIVSCKLRVPSLEESKKAHVQALYFEWNSDEALGDAKVVKANTSVLYSIKGGHFATEVEEIFPAP